MVASVFTGCVKEDVFTGIDENKPAPKEFKYDEVSSSATSIAVYWDARDAVKHGATSFTVQIPTELNNGNNYVSGEAQTLKITDQIYDAATFSGLTEYDRHYVRVRANYPNSIYSEWVYLTVNGKRAPFDVGYGFVDTELAGVKDTEYDAAESSVTAMAFTFTTDGANEASAIRFQLINNANDAISKTLTISATDTKVKFEDLKEGDQYKVRARVEYPGEGILVTCSEWVYISGITAEESKESDVFEVGKGAVIPKDVAPTAELVVATSSTLTFKWSECGFTSKTKDLKRPYNVQLYKDKACTDLVVSWKLKANQSEYSDKQPAFLFSGLDQNTTYYFVVTDDESNLTSEPLEAKTLEFNVVTVGETPVEVGSYALAEDFSEFVWGGDHVHGGIAYSSNGRSSAPTLDKASGENPVGKGSGFYLIPSSTEMGLFNTLDDAVPTTRLAKWGAINEGTANSYVCARSGHLKLGASSYTVDLATPVLSNLKETATVEVSFDAAQYGTDPRTVAIKVVYAATEAGSNVLTDVSAQVAQELTIDEGGYKTYTYEISNVSPTSRIAIGAKREGTEPGKKQHRFYIDNVKVKVVSYVAIQLDAPVVEEPTFDAESISLKWGAVDKALTYTVEYKETAASEWTVVDGLTATEYAIEGLKDETSYDVRVKAVAGESSSDYSAVKTVTTLKKAAFPKTINNADELVALFESGELVTAAATDKILLAADIDMTGKTLKAGEVFGGILDGQNHVIKNWTATNAMFETVKGGICNLTIDASCVGTPAGDIFGMLANNCEGTIENVVNNANITKTYSAAPEGATVIGGIVAKSTGEIKNCVNNGKITVDGATVALNSSLIGGIAGYQTGATDNADNNGAITVTALTFNTIVAIGDVSSAPIMAAGIFAYSGSTVKNCENTGKITYSMTALEQLATGSGLGRVNIAGVVAAPNGDITSCKNSADIDVKCVTSTGEGYNAKNYILCIGSISGGDDYAPSDNGTNITDCENTGNITVDADNNKSNYAIGGIVGWPGVESAKQTVVTKNCVNRGNVTVMGECKGRFGGIQGGAGNIEGCTNYGVITNETDVSGGCVGGVAGYSSYNLIFKNNANYGDVVNNDGEGDLVYAGGLIGAYAGQAGNGVGAGSKVKCNLVVNGTQKYAGMILGRYNGGSKKLELGTADSPVKVSGSIKLGTADAVTITAENLDTYVTGTERAKDPEVRPIHAVYGE